MRLKQKKNTGQTNLQKIDIALVGKVGKDSAA